jgi:uncharacterized protein (DUF486 family)
MKGSRSCRSILVSAAGRANAAFRFPLATGLSWGNTEERLLLDDLEAPMTTILLQTITLLVLSNVFMNIAWYGHLKSLREQSWYIAALVSWGIALFEYLLQVPANRIGYTQFSMSQLKILQEVISLSVFVAVAVLYLKEPVKTNYAWAALCMFFAVYFVFKE